MKKFETSFFVSALTLSSAVVALQSPAAHAKKLLDYPGAKYDVLFTDPVCPSSEGIEKATGQKGVTQYTYSKPVVSNSGATLTGKPKDAYCRNRFDLAASGGRDGSKPSGIPGRSDESPQNRLVKWVEGSDVKEIFFTYLSFRNKAVKNALCARAQQGLPITFVNSSTEDPTVANELVACAQPGKNNVKFLQRGMEGGIGYAHNKIFMINPNSTTTMKIAFSSGNMTSGPVIHHENWHFIEVPAQAYFAQVHRCVMQAEVDESTGRDRTKYMNYVRDCRAKITAPEEEDIKAFFVPGEGEKGQDWETHLPFDNGSGRKTAWDYMRDGDGINPGIRGADQILVGCHRFFYSRMINALHEKMNFGASKVDLRIVADDDTYYKGVDPNYGVGDTDPSEWTNMEELQQRGAGVRFIETNPDEHQLHHSKYLIFGKKNPASGKFESKAVFCGAANLTGAGFRKNWENVYYVTVPKVVQAFRDHYEYMWNRVATPVENLPKPQQGGGLQGGLLGELLMPASPM